jgi:hypothetical protein
MKAITAAILTAGALKTPWLLRVGTAHADPNNPVTNSACNHAHMNDVAPDIAGQQLRCVSIPGGFFWEPDKGPQQDGKLRDDATPEQRDSSYAYCMQHSQRPWECKQIVYGGGPEPDYRATDD